MLTNKTPSGTYRGPAQYEAAFFRERMVDRLAKALDADPAELRARNLVAVDAMPYRMELADITPPVIYDNGDFPEVVVDPAAPRRPRAPPRRAGAAPRARRARRRRHGRLRRGDRVRPLRVRHASRRARTAAGSPTWAWPRSGQGVRTALAQVVADQLQVPLEEVEISHRDTDLVPHGFGAYASRTTIIGGGAVVGAVDDLKRKAIAAAAERLEIAEPDLELGPGAVVAPRGNPGRGLPMAELGCVGEHRFDKPLPTFDMGACLAAGRGRSRHRRRARRAHGRLPGHRHRGQPAAGRRPARGRRRPGRRRHAVRGARLRPLGPAAGHVVHGLPDAHRRRGAAGRHASQLDLPHWDESTGNPLHAKAAGEGGIVGSGAAIANAVADAVGDDPGLSRLPLTPSAMLAVVGEEPS